VHTIYIHSESYYQLIIIMQIKHALNTIMTFTKIVY